MVAVEQFFWGCDEDLFTVGCPGRPVRQEIEYLAGALALYQALRDAGADSTYHLLAGAGHGMLSLNRRQARQWTSVQVLTLITEFLDRTLRS